MSCVSIFFKVIFQTKKKNSYESFVYGCAVTFGDWDLYTWFKCFKCTISDGIFAFNFLSIYAIIILILDQYI